MTLTIRFLGIELLHIALEETAYEEELTNGGETGITVVGFTAEHQVPDEAPLPSRGWEDRHR